MRDVSAAIDDDARFEAYVRTCLRLPPDLEGAPAAAAAAAGAAPAAPARERRLLLVEAILERASHK
jgi:hypothetical protein